MSCERFWEQLDAAALSQLPPSVQAELEAHAAGCPDCAQALATERLLSQTLAPSRILRPSRSLQEALLAVPRQAERGRRLRALGVFALPVSVLALGLLAFLAPELLRGQRTAIEEAQPAAGPSAADVDMAGATATMDLDRATVARPTTSPAAAGLAGGRREAGAASPTPRSARLRPLAPGSAPARSVAPSAAPTAGPSPQLAPAPPPRPQRPRPRPSATPAPPEAGDMGAGQSGPGQVPPLPRDPDPTDPADPTDPRPTGSSLVPGPAETGTPESGPPGGGRSPETTTPESTPEASRAMTPGPITATPISGDPGQPIPAPSDTHTPTPTPSPTPTATP